MLFVQLRRNQKIMNPGREQQRISGFLIHSPCTWNEQPEFPEPLKLYCLMGLKVMKRLCQGGLPSDLVIAEVSAKGPFYTDPLLEILEFRIFLQGAMSLFCVECLFMRQLCGVIPTCTVL